MNTIITVMIVIMAWKTIIGAITSVLSVRESNEKWAKVYKELADKNDGR